MPLGDLPISLGGAEAAGTTACVQPRVLDAHPLGHHVGAGQLLRLGQVGRARSTGQRMDGAVLVDEEIVEGREERRKPGRLNLLEAQRPRTRAKLLLVHTGRPLILGGALEALGPHALFTERTERDPPAVDSQPQYPLAEQDRAPAERAALHPPLGFKQHVLALTALLAQGQRGSQPVGQRSLPPLPHGLLL